MRGLKNGEFSNPLKSSGWTTTWEYIDQAPSNSKPQSHWQPAYLFSFHVDGSAGTVPELTDTKQSPEI